MAFHKPDSSLLQPDSASSAGRIARPLPPASLGCPRELPGHRQVRNRHTLSHTRPLPRGLRHGVVARLHRLRLGSAGDPRMTEDGLLFVDTDRFNGPLDLLLHLIRTQDIDIFDIPDRTDHAGSSWSAIEGIWPWPTWTKPASFWRWPRRWWGSSPGCSCPSPAGEEDHDPRAELVRRLLEYETDPRRSPARLRTWPRTTGDAALRKGYVQPRRRAPGGRCAARP